MQQALHAAAEVDERAEVAHRCDPACQHRAGDDGPPDLVGGRPLLFLEQGPPRHHEVSAAFFEFDDPELVDTAYMRRRLGPDDVDLGERAEPALTGDRDLEAALHLAFDFSLHRQAAVERVLELRERRGAARQLPRERQPSDRRHHDGLNAIAAATSISPSSSFSSGTSIVASPLPPTSMNATSGPIATMVPSMVWPPLESLRLERGLEHRREIFFELVHEAPPAAV